MSRNVSSLISVIIITYNRCRELERCLDSLMAQKNTNFEIVVVDGGSTDCTIDLIKQYPIKFVRESKRSGISAARNLGISNSKGGIVVFLDDDAIAEKDWLKSLVKPFEDERIAGVSGKVIPITNTLFNREFAPDYDQGPDIKETKYFVGCNMAFRKSALIEAGYFDTKIKYGHDENELCSRLLSAGYLLVYTPYAVAHHDYVPSFSALLRKKFKLGKSRAYLEKKLGHHSDSKKRIIYIILIPVAIVVLSLGAVSFYLSMFKPYFWCSVFLTICYVVLLTAVIKYRSKKSIIGAFLTIFTEFVRELGKIYGRLFPLTD
ncbi:glycosyltransferase family 2 protein [Candidatus Borrarchaeum sp.]|uniref:glycosyltransferase family 2 protein n=1 Tax=Candidatus Borrarchaeum sp. TaxID=2846742 RepID=UPI00257BD8CE|nr:glycosyltransferase [Candidatus Borrarchaeum sp.]